MDFEALMGQVSGSIFGFFWKAKMNRSIGFHQRGRASFCFFLLGGMNSTSLYISEITLKGRLHGQSGSISVFWESPPRPGFSQIRLVRLKPLEELGAIQRTHGEFPSSIAIAKLPSVVNPMNLQVWRFILPVSGDSVFFF